MLEPRIQQHFFESADLMYQVSEHLSHAIAEAAQAAVGCLTSGGKLLVGGQGAGQALAQLLCDALMSRFERERPALAALLLRADLAAPLATEPASHADAAIARQVRSFGQAGDLLVVFCPTGGDAVWQAAIDDAHAKEISVLLLSGPAPGDLPGRLIDTDVWVGVPHQRPARVLELQLLALHALCDAIDIQLLGEADAA
jgi:D-sedoheptulose 7-phosphate isomerase